MSENVAYKKTKPFVLYRELFTDKKTHMCKGSGYLSSCSGDWKVHFPDASETGEMLGGANPVQITVHLLTKYHFALSF